MKTINCLRLASFIGNIGDNANHLGSAWLHRHFTSGKVFAEQQLEIRQYYWKKNRFNESFVDYVNEFDLFIIGGGNYLELWPEKSATGTSLDIPSDVLDKIKTPIVLYSLGCDDGQGASKINVEKFKSFINYLAERKDAYISLRNDGSSDTFLKYLGPRYADTFSVIPDGGFFLGKVEELTAPEGFQNRETTIAINVAGDMLPVRFDQRTGLSYEQFLVYFADVMTAMLNQGFNLVFIPHIYKDLKVINDLLGKLDDHYIRTKIKVAPCIQGIEGMRFNFGIYKEVNLVLGTRFHANVCPIGLGVPTIGLSSYPQIERLFTELGLSENMVFINKTDFRCQLTDLIDKCIREEEFQRNRLNGINTDLYDMAKQSFADYSKWLDNYFGG